MIRNASQVLPFIALSAALAWALSASLEAQQAGSLAGVVVDAETGQAIAEVAVRIEGRARGTLTDEAGRFVLNVPRGAELRIRFDHLAYGTSVETVPIESMASDVMLRVRLAPGVVELDPVEVVADGREARARRTRGTGRNVVTREEIESAMGSGGNVGTALERFVTGVRIRNPQRSPGQAVCLEFRSGRSLDDPRRCHSPLVIMDGVRISNTSHFVVQMPLTDITRMELIPPGEAGVSYGTDSNYGVLLIETVSGPERRRDTETFAPIARYDFAEEGVPYDWKRTFLSAFVGNAAGVGLGWVAARNCLDFEGLSAHFLDSTCGTAGTAGARIALLTLPVAGTASAARWGGRSEQSQGRLLALALSAALMGAPGYLLSATGEQDAWSGADVLGKTLVFVGIPAMVTWTDRLFRERR